jgi:DnaJ family protein C protein 7
MFTQCCTVSFILFCAILPTITTQAYDYKVEQPYAQPAKSSFLERLKTGLQVQLSKDLFLFKLELKDSAQGTRAEYATKVKRVAVSSFAKYCQENHIVSHSKERVMLEDYCATFCEQFVSKTWISPALQRDPKQTHAEAVQIAAAASLVKSFQRDGQSYKDEALLNKRFEADRQKLANLKLSNKLFDYYVNILQGHYTRLRVALHTQATVTKILGNFSQYATREALVNKNKSLLAQHYNSASQALRKLQFPNNEQYLFAIKKLTETKDATEKEIDRLITADKKAEQNKKNNQNSNSNRTNTTIRANSYLSFYDALSILELDKLGRNPTQTEITKAFRKQSLKWHPDRHFNESKVMQKEAEIQFTKVNNANNLLLDLLEKGKI